MQPAWLETRAQVWFYLLFSRLAVGLLLGVIVFCLFKETIGYVLTVVLICTLVGVVDMIRLLVFHKPINKTSIGIVYIVGCSVCFALSLYLLGLLTPRPTLSDVVGNGIIMGMIYGLFFWLRSRNRDLNCDIKTLEVVRWSWSAGWNTSKIWIFGAGGLAFMGSLISLFLFGKNLTREMALGPIITVFLYGVVSLICGIIFGMYFGVVAFLFGGIKAGIREGKGVLNQGIMLTLKNSTWLAGSLTIAFASVFIGLILLTGLLVRQNPITYFMGSLPTTYVFVLDFAIAVWVGFGAIDVLNHYFLRLMAAGMGYMPLRYAHFLNYASKLRLLQKVGGSYLFIHRLLLEHLAAQYAARKNNP